MNNIAIIFPGQGSQSIGMFQELYEKDEIIRKTIMEAETLSGINISGIVKNGPVTSLLETKNAHIIILAYGVAAFRYYMEHNMPEPRILAGHSLGEYTALVCAGVISMKDAIDIILKRCDLGQKIAEQKNAGMCIVEHIDTNELENYCGCLQQEGKEVFIACRNSNSQSSLSGKTEDLFGLRDWVRNSKGIFTPLMDNPPFHCEMMEEGVTLIDEYRESFSNPVYNILSGVEADLYEDKYDCAIKLKKHMTSTIHWDECLQYMSDIGIDHVLDLSANSIFHSIIIAHGMQPFSINEMRLYCKDLSFVNPEHKIAIDCQKAVISEPYIGINDMRVKEKIYQLNQKLKKTTENIITDKELPLKYLDEILELKKVSLDCRRWWETKIKIDNNIFSN